MKQIIANYFMTKKQFFYLFGYIFLRKYSFKKIKKMSIPMGWGNAICTSQVTVPLERVYANLKTKTGLNRSKITDTPHFNYLAQSKEENVITYEDYITSYFPQENLKEKIDNFNNLQTLVTNSPEKFFILVKKELVMFTDKEFKIIDGLHRASILKYSKNNYAKCLIVDEIKS